jgi:hypothetical protein
MLLFGAAFFFLKAGIDFLLREQEVLGLKGPDTPGHR